MYGSLSTLANVTSNGVCVYLKLFSVTDANQRRLVRSKMSTIFKPNVRRALNLNTSDSSQGIFGGVSNVLKNMEESKKINMLVKSSLLQTKKSRQALRLARTKVRSLQLGDPRPRARKEALKRRPVVRIPKPTRPLTTPRRRSSTRLRRRTKRNISL